MNYQQTNISTNCIVEGNNIFSLDIYGNQSCIGVTTEAFLEMKKTAELATEKAEAFYNEKEEYFNKLVENGLAVRPKTQEEINQELKSEIENQRATNNLLLEAIQELTRKIGESDESKRSSTNSAENGHKPSKAKPSAKDGE